MFLLFIVLFLFFCKESFFSMIHSFKVLKQPRFNLGWSNSVFYLRNIFMATLSLTSWVLTLHLDEPNSQGHLRFSKRGDPGNETVCLVTV